MFDADNSRETLQRQLEVATLQGFGIDDLLLALPPAGALLHYLGQARKDLRLSITELRTYSVDGFMTLDQYSRRNLEVMRTAKGDILGRDHYPDCYTMVMAGGGVKGGLTYGESDELGFSVATDKVHVHDLQATILHLLGFNHERLTFRFQGRDYRLTDVYGQVVREILV